MLKSSLVLIIFSVLHFNSFCQEVPNLGNKLDSLAEKKDSLGFQLNNINPKAYNQNTILTRQSYFQLLGSTLKQSFTKPLNMTKEDAVNLGKFALITGTLMLADKPVQKEALRLRNRSQAVRDYGNYVSRFGGLYEGYTLLGLGAYGFFFKNQKIKTTTLLATQAYITGAAVHTVFKLIAGRTRPSFYDPQQEAHPTFKGPFGNSTTDYLGKSITSSFPSGHSTVAFAAATVFAMEYKNKLWVPIFAYTSASLIAISRISENKHWLSDIFAGTVLGILSGRQVVNNYHRYATIKSTPKQKRKKISLGINDNRGHLEPSFVYHIP